MRCVIFKSMDTVKLSILYTINANSLVCNECMLEWIDLTFAVENNMMDQNCLNAGHIQAAYIWQKENDYKCQHCGSVNSQQDPYHVMIPKSQ